MMSWVRDDVMMHYEVAIEECITHVCKDVQHSS